MPITRPTIGEDFSTAAQKIDGSLRYIDFANRISAYRSGMLGRVAIGGWGDSMHGNETQPGWAAAIAVARMLHHNADVMVHREGPANGGHNYAVGGTTTQHMLDVQLPQILAAYDAGTLPPVMWGSPLQNDGFGAVGEAEAAAQRCITFWTALLQRNIIVVSMGVYPKSDVGAATENAFARHYLERRLSEWAAKQIGMFYIPILDALKSGNPTEEAQGLIQYKGTPGQVGAASDDRVHLRPYGVRLITGRVGEVLPQIAPAVKKPVFDALDYDETRNRYGNVLGTQGRLIGSGGKINGVTSANVPAGLELLYDTTKGITLTPTLTGDVRYPLRLVSTGTATADIAWAVRLTSTSKVSDFQTSFIYGEARWNNAANWAGIAVGNAGQGDPGIGSGDVIISFPGCGSRGAGHIMPDALNEAITFHSMAPFPLGNSGSRPLRYDVSGAILSGTSPTGSLDIGWQGIFRTDTPI